MLRLEENIRLARREAERFTKITGFTPVNVDSLDDLDAYIGQCNFRFRGVRDDTKFLRFLLDEGCSRCLGFA